MRYLQLDVFTDRPFEGNQLAVFPEPGGLSTAQMQTIAREMNFSESTFIFPAEGGGADPRAGRAKMRIFTPGADCRWRGIPTIGSTFALAHEGTIAAGQTISCSSSESGQRRCRSNGPEVRCRSRG